MTSFIEIYENGMKDLEVPVKVPKGSKVSLIDDLDKLDMDINDRRSKYEMDYVYHNLNNTQYCLFTKVESATDFFEYTHKKELAPEDKVQNESFVNDLFDYSFKVEQDDIKSKINKDFYPNPVEPGTEAKISELVDEAFNQNYSKYIDLKNILISLINNCPDNFNFRNKEEKSKILSKTNFLRYLTLFNKLNKNIMINKGNLKSYDIELKNKKETILQTCDELTKSLIEKYIDKFSSTNCTCDKVHVNDLIIKYESSDIDYMSYVMKEKIIQTCNIDNTEDRKLICAKYLDVNNKITVIGDLHGSLFNLIRILFRLRSLNILDERFRLNTKTTIDNSSRHKIVFLGDIIDSGYYSLEIYYIIILLKLINPEDVYIIRGNHEYSSENERVSAPNGIYSIDMQQDLDHKFITNIIFGGRLSFNLECKDMDIEPDVIFNSYKYLPSALFLQVEEKSEDEEKLEERDVKFYYFVHGGLSPYFTTKIFNQEENYENIIIEKKIMDDMMWSDFLHDINNPNIYEDCKKYDLQSVEFKNFLQEVNNNNEKKLVQVIGQLETKITTYITKEGLDKLKSQREILTWLQSEFTEKDINAGDIKKLGDFVNNMNNLKLNCTINELNKDSIFTKIHKYNNSEIFEVLIDLLKPGVRTIRNAGENKFISELISKFEMPGLTAKDDVLSSVFRDSTEYNTYTDQNKGVILNYLQTFLLILTNNIKFIFRGHQDKFINTRLFNYNTLLEVNFNNSNDKSLNFNGEIIKNLNNNTYKNMIDQYYLNCFTNDKFNPHLASCPKEPIMVPGPQFDNMTGMAWDKFEDYKGELSGTKELIQEYITKNSDSEMKSLVGKIKIPKFNEIKKMYKLFAPLLTLSTAESKFVKKDSFIIINIEKETKDFGSSGISASTSTPPSTLTLTQPPVLAGGSYNNQIYKNKYLKYKQKYLFFKNKNNQSK
jgi:hypothetical protein